jgi:hypothetical protein
LLILSILSSNIGCLIGKKKKKNRFRMVYCVSDY